jgi:hypothetical protein
MVERLPHYHKFEDLTLATAGAKQMGKMGGKCCFVGLFFVTSGALW